MNEENSDPSGLFCSGTHDAGMASYGHCCHGVWFRGGPIGLFLRLLRAQGGEGPTHGLSPYVGTALIIVGGFAIGGGCLAILEFLVEP